MKKDDPSIKKPYSKSNKKRSKLQHWWYGIIGFVALLWILFRSGTNPGRLSYPCQQAAMPAAVSWIMAVVAFFGGSILLRRFARFSGIAIAAIGVIWFLNVLPEFGISEDNTDLAAASLLISNEDPANNQKDFRFVCGDADASGSLNILDITFIIVYLYKGGPAPDPIESADVNNTGNVNILDITYLINYLYEGGAEPNCPPGQDISRVIIVEDENATSGSTIDESIVQIMVDSGVTALAQLNDVGEAWKSLFPGINSSSVIAIKVNSLHSNIPTRPEVTYAVVEGLKQMFVGGSPFPENNIIIYDRATNELTASGYTANTSGTGVRCFGTNEYGVGYSSELYDVNGVNQKISKIVTEIADYIVNIAVLKNHYIAGVTLCLKNHYGTCDDPEALHGSNCSMFIPALNATSPIADKQVVSICDALFGIKSGGPGGYPQFAANKIIMSQDVVAVDYWGMTTLEENGCTTTSIATHIANAATIYGLGTNDPAQMDVVNVTNPSVKK